MAEKSQHRSVMSYVAAVLALLVSLVAGVPAVLGQEVEVEEPSLAVSRSPGRFDPVPLDGATVAPEESLAIFVTPLDLPADRVRFAVNGVQVRSDFFAPWDLGGTNQNGRARLVVAGELLQPGENLVEARVNIDGGVTLLSATVILASDDDASDDGAYDHGAYDHGAYDHGAYDHGAYDHGAYDHGAYDHDASSAV